MKCGQREPREALIESHSTCNLFQVVLNHPETQHSGARWVIHSLTQRRMERKRKQRRKKARKRRFRTGFWGSLSFTGLISRLSHNSQIVWHLDYTVNSRVAYSEEQTE